VCSRWEQPDHPDPSGEQLAKLRAYLHEHPEVRHVFVDYMCLAQGERTAADKAEFGQMLANINLLYLGCRVLVLMDRTYMSRFWTSFEAWLAMRKASAQGLGSLRDGASRCDIVCVHGAPKSLADALREEWRECGASAAAQKLQGPDFFVTNKGDKDVQISKLVQLEEQVRRYAQQHGVQRPSGASAASPPKPWLEELLTQARVPNKLHVALSWCDEKGVNSLDTLREAQMEQCLVDALDLKEARAAVLLKRLKEAES